MTNLTETIEKIVSLLGAHPNATLLPCDSSGPGITEEMYATWLKEDLDAMVKAYEPTVGWTLFWMEGDMEHSHLFEVKLKTLKESIEELEPTLRALFQVGMKSAEGRKFICDVLHQMGRNRHNADYGPIGVRTLEVDPLPARA